ncbi:MAG: hypothetical protein NTW49_04800 [Bacteroidia bacterium]|nr:hypothetical protein [Bacteroidia bacterium]
MKTSVATVINKQSLTNTLYDLAALCLVYFVPAISHFLSVPLYLAEPMRILVILALFYTSSRNAYLLAFTLPIFSFVVSAHPVFLKTFLITIELSLNVWLFYILKKFLRKPYLTILVSILASKSIYYLLKFILISTLLLNSDLISTPLYIQASMTLVFCLYALIFVNRQTERLRDEETKRTKRTGD